MTVHRLACCCNPDQEAQPRLVRGGWYHFLVNDTKGGVTCIIGKPTEVGMSYNDGDCIPNGDDYPACVVEVIPVPAPAGHPLAVPSSLLSAASPSGKAVIDIECGAYHNIARCSDHTIVAWGLNAMGQCNVPTTSSKGDLTDPANPELTRIVGLHAGYSNSAVSFNDGTVVCWGDPEVATVVNGWTDIMMSPVQHTYEGATTFRDVNNVDADKPQYARPAYRAAYNASATNVWNVKQDPGFYWHDYSSDTHCVPFFDLGVETNPHNPMNWRPGESTGFDGNTNTRYPGWPVTFTDGTPCDVTQMAVGAEEQFERWLDQRLRNQAFAEVDRSCCHLEIKKDFAVAMRRTGQIITTRSNNAKVAGDANNPGCPTGYSDGRSHCRDCSIDKVIGASCTPMPNGKAGCPAPSGWCDEASCACCYVNAVGNCPECQNFIDPTAQTFTVPSPCGGPWGTTSFYAEGIGCVSADASVDELHYNHEWATPWVQSFTPGNPWTNPPTNPICTGGLMKRWIAGEQCRDGAEGQAVPYINFKIQENFGWSTMPSAEGLLYVGAQATKCVVTHAGDIGTETNAVKCARLNRTSSTYQPANIDPEFASNYGYPNQMRMNALVCGTNTSVWQTQANGVGSYGFNGTECVGCPTWPAGNLNCRMNYLQLSNPNSGTIAYGVIYAGDDVLGDANPNPTGGQALGRDKYGYANEYRYAFGASCAGGPSINIPKSWAWPSKPWGPHHIIEWQGIGHDLSTGGQWNQVVPYPLCHCCTPDDPSDPAADPMQNKPPHTLEVVPYDASFDGTMGTLAGFPFETNMRCGGQLDGQGSPYATWCNASCQWLYNEVCFGTGNPSYSYLGSSFCVHNKPRSWASGRLSFAMIRADHRDCERDASGQCLRDENGNAIRANPPYGQCLGPCNMPPWKPSVPGDEWNSCADKTQFVGCLPPNCDVSDSGRPVILTEMMLHIWGSLWDPCPPWPRECVCLSVGDPPQDPPPDYPFQDYPADLMWDYSTPCDAAAGSGTLPDAEPGTIRYPAWIRQARPADRRAGRGYWLWTGLQWQWAVEDEDDLESLGPITRYCPDCSEVGTMPGGE